MAPGDPQLRPIRNNESLCPGWHAVEPSPSERDTSSIASANLDLMRSIYEAWARCQVKTESAQAPLESTPLWVTRLSALRRPLRETASGEGTSHALASSCREHRALVPKRTVPSVRLSEWAGCTSDK